MAVKSVLDTNAVLYLLGGKLAEPLPPGAYFVSVITELELLCYPALDPRGEAEIRAFLGDVSLAELTPDIKSEAIGLRRRHGLKLPDAIVAGTAVALGAELLTNDARLLSVPGVSGRPLTLR